MKTYIAHMEKIVQVILVEHNPVSQKEIEKSIRESGISKDVKIALNGGHALLYLEHLHLTNKVQDNTLLILLNPDTPMVDGFEFLRNYHSSKTFRKENIQIAIIHDNLSAEKKSKATSMGVSCFLSPQITPATLTSLINAEGRSVTAATQTKAPLPPVKSRAHSYKSHGLGGSR